jgi:hypothetical protein
LKVWYNVTIGVSVAMSDVDLVNFLMWYHLTPGVAIVDLLLVSIMLSQA